jgi:hypothetical protein
MHLVRREEDIPVEKVVVQQLEQAVTRVEAAIKYMEYMCFSFLSFFPRQMLGVSS